MDLGALYEHIRGLKPSSPERQMAATVSPLLYALHLKDEIEPYEHMRYLDAHVLALCNLQLYPDGPGPAAEVWIRHQEGIGLFEKLGVGFEIAVSDEAHDADELFLCRPGADGAALGPDGVDPGDHVVFRLAIALPPRHGKSMLVTEHLPRWFLTRHPDNSVVVATFNETMAEKWGQGLQEDLKEQAKVLPTASDGLPLSPIQSTKAVTSFRPGKDRGEINFRGIGGTLTGTGWGLGIIDDPFKDQEDALSAAVRQKRKDWYSSVFRTRRTRRRGSPPPLEVMMFTRWHEDDLAGAFAYEEDGETPRAGWCVLRLPALAESGDVLGREEGESLCPQLVPRAVLEGLRAESPLWFECINQGNPSHESGSMFAKTRIGADGVARYHHWVRRGSGDFQALGTNQQFPVSDLMVFITVDTATSKRKQADYTVFSLWGWHSATGTLILIDRYKDRIGTESHREVLLSFVGRHAAFKLMFIGIEDKTFGTGLINELRAKSPELVIVPIKVDRDKVANAVPYAEAVQAGKVLFPAPTERPWTVDWENEHARFPNARWDDQVDTGSIAWRKCQDYAYTPSEEPEPEPETHVRRNARQLRLAQGVAKHDYQHALEMIRRTS